MNPTIQNYLTKRELIREYEEILVGRRKRISTFYINGNVMPLEDVAITIFRYVFDELLKWKPETAIEYFTEDIAKQLMLEPYIKPIPKIYRLIYAVLLSGHTLTFLKVKRKDFRQISFPGSTKSSKQLFVLIMQLTVSFISIISMSIINTLLNQLGKSLSEIIISARYAENVSALPWNTLTWHFILNSAMKCSLSFTSTCIKSSRRAHL